MATLFEAQDILDYVGLRFLHISGSSIFCLLLAWIGWYDRSLLVFLVACAAASIATVCFMFDYKRRVKVRDSAKDVRTAALLEQHAERLSRSHRPEDIIKRSGDGLALSRRPRHDK